MRKITIILVLFIVSVVLATTYHTLPFNGQNSFDQDEDFATSTDTVWAYCTWDDQYLYLGLASPFLATENDTARGRYDSFWYIDTDPHPENPKSGLGTDQSGSYFIQINTSWPWWFDEQKWELPFYADYRIIPRYFKKDSVYASFYYYDSDSAKWFFRGDIDTSLANLNYIDGYYELRLPLDSLNFPTDINILGYSVDGAWESDLYWDDEYGFTRDVGGTFASWPWSSIQGGDGDYDTHGKLNHWFHFHLQPGISPDQENDPPVSSAIPDQTITSDSSFSVIDLNQYVFDDLTPDTLLSWTVQDNQVTINILDNNQAQVDPPYPGWLGSDTVTFIVTDEGGKSDTTSAVFTVDDNPSSLVGWHDNYPQKFTLLPNFPNPFNPSTTITYGLSKNSDVQIEIFNMLGQRVYQKTEANMARGYHTFKLNASGWSSGVYLYRISAENKTITRKMVLVR